MIDKNKQYRTVSGNDVRIYATDGGKGTPIHGAYNLNGEWFSECWTAAGLISTTEGRHYPSDLVEVKPRHKRTFWLNIQHVDFITVGEFFTDKRMADRSLYSRVACVRVEIDFEEGEGLD